MNGNPQAAGEPERVPASTPPAVASGDAAAGRLPARVGDPGRRPGSSPGRRAADPRSPVRVAWMIAIAADLLEIVLMPAFASGILSPANDVVDVVTAFLLWRLLGWHIAFLPTFAAELIPGVSLIPTWTAAVWLATRGRKRPPPREVSSAEVID
jgi:hypothetical protein